MHSGNLIPMHRFGGAATKLSCNHNECNGNRALSVGHVGECGYIGQEN
jgi:hypothetical protein